MPAKEQTILTPLARRCRMVSASLIAAFWMGKSGEDVEAQIEVLPTNQQAIIITGVLGLLFLISLFAAQFGYIGMAILLASVVLILR